MRRLNAPGSQNADYVTSYGVPVSQRRHAFSVVMQSLEDVGYKLAVGLAVVCLEKADTLFGNLALG
jgi:hypothetical protein